MRICRSRDSDGRRRYTGRFNARLVIRAAIARIARRYRHDAPGSNSVFNSPCKEIKTTACGPAKAQAENVEPIAYGCFNRIRYFISRPASVPVENAIVAQISARGDARDKTERRCGIEVACRNARYVRAVTVLILRRSRGGKK